MANDEPLVKLEAEGRASILSYNVPDPTSYPGRFNLGLYFDFDGVTPQDIFTPEIVDRPVFTLRRLGAPPDPEGEGGRAGPGSGRPDIEVDEPGMIFAPPDRATVITGGHVYLRATRKRASPPPADVKFRVTRPDGVTSSHNATAGAAGTWNGSFPAPVTGRYKVEVVAVIANDDWTSPAKFIQVTTQPPPAKPRDLTAPELSATLVNVAPIVLGTNGTAAVSIDFTAHDAESGNVTTTFIVDEQPDTAPAVAPAADGASRYTRNFTAPGTHSVRIQASNRDNLSASRTINFEIFRRETVPLAQHLVLIYCVQLSNFLGSYGAGRTIQTFSLLPGEKTRISIKTYSSTTSTASEARSIMDGYDESSAEEFEDAVSQETGTKANDQSHFAASASVEASGSWGFASAKVAGSVSGGSSAAVEQFSKNLSNAVAKHTAAKSARRQAEVNYSTTTTTTSGEEKTIERTIENINVSRTLNFVFRQLNQEFVSLLHLTDVRLAHVIQNPDQGMPLPGGEDPEAVQGPWLVREVPLAEMDSLIASVVRPEHIAKVTDAIVHQLNTVCDYRGRLIPVIETIHGQRPRRDALGELIYEDGADGELIVATERDGSSYRRFRELTQTYADASGNAFSVPGVILRASKNTLRSDGVIVEALLGQANALDAYSTSLQAETVRQREVENAALETRMEREKRAMDIIGKLPAEDQPGAYAVIFGEPPVYHRDEDGG